MRTLFVACTFAALSYAALAQSTDLPLRPGHYSVTSTSQNPGQAAGPGNGGQHCLTAADMKDPEVVFDPAFYATNRKNDTCHVTNFSHNGSSITYDVQCPRAFFHVEATISGDTFKGSRVVKPRPGAATRVTYTFEGKRTGECH